MADKWYYTLYWAINGKCYTLTTDNIDMAALCGRQLIKNSQVEKCEMVIKKHP